MSEASSGGFATDCCTPDAVPPRGGGFATGCCTPEAVPPPAARPKYPSPIATAASTEIDAALLQRMLDGRYAELREQLREVLSSEEFAPPIAIPTDEYRELVFRWAQSLAEEVVTAPGFPERYGGQNDPGGNVAAFETLAFGDLSLLVKFGVQFGLCGGAIHQLGTQRHHERYL